MNEACDSGEAARLTSRVAHEIKNPLHALVLQVALLRGRFPEVSEAKRHLDILEAAVKRLDLVVQSLLKFIGPTNATLGPIRIEPVLREAVASAGPRLEGAGLRVGWEVAPDLPEVRGNAELLKEAFLHLIANACEAVSEKGGELRIRAAQGAGQTVELVLEDTGSGIAPDALPMIFNLFYTTKRDATGIGLSMVHRVVQHHGGEIHVESLEGKGTRVALRLPLAQR